MVTGWTSVQSMTKTVYHMLKTLSHCVNQTFVTNLHLLRVKLRCKLQKRLRYLTGPLVVPVRNLLLLTKKPPLLPNFLLLTYLILSSGHLEATGAETDLDNADDWQAWLFNACCGETHFSKNNRKSLVKCIPLDYHIPDITIKFLYSFNKKM